MPTPTHAAILSIESQWWRYAGAKEQHVREQLGVSMPRYHVLVNAMLDDPAAWEADPITCRRLRDRRDAVRALRSA